MAFWENIGRGSVEEGRKAANEVVERIGPILLQVEHRAAGILHGLLTRLNKTKIILTIEIPEQPYPDEKSEIRKGEKA